MLYRWFLGMDLMEPSLDATVFTRHRRKLLRHRVGRKLFEEVAYEADRRGLMSDEDFRRGLHTDRGSSQHKELQKAWTCERPSVDGGEQHG